MKTPTNETSGRAETSNELSAPTSSNELLHSLLGMSQAEQSQARKVAADTRNLETLIRLIVRDELQRGLTTASREPRSARSTDETTGSTGVTDAAQRPDDDDADADVMSAEDVAAFLGVDRNTVYDYAGRGTIPCRRLGKRLLFHRPVLVSWLDPCKAASTRKA